MEYFFNQPSRGTPHMARRKTNPNLTVIENYNSDAQTVKQKSTLKMRVDDLVTIDALTETQGLFLSEYTRDAKAMLLHGCAGTGKTYIALYRALEEVLTRGNPYKKVVIIRSAVPSREIGHLPGDETEKTAVYMQPYIDMCADLFPTKQQAFQRLIEQKHIDWMITSFVRGITLDNAVIIVDECQNMNDMEINSIITRVGHNSKIIFCGDFRQTDLYKRGDMSGLQKFMIIADNMPSFRTFEFGTDDIVRSDLVKEYLIALIKYEEEYGT
jgi:predicted ribonuclease YlaK|tara:strand:+ start:2518 stop:3327 length:810 start_codon:yes stop_codon:yes gene_type:complete